MKEKPVISNAVIRRLPRYRRYLKDLKNSTDKVSSKELSELTGYTASQIRQDLNNFGDFGQQGYGYNVDVLFEGINAIIGLGKTYKMIIAGGGNLGKAIANHNYYYKTGFIVTAIFDKNPELIGKKIRDIEIYDYLDMKDYIQENEIDIGIICTTKDSAQEVADIYCSAGVRGIWNFAPIDLDIPDNVCIENVHLSDALYSLAYYMNNPKSE